MVPRFNHSQRLSGVLTAPRASEKLQDTYKQTESLWAPFLVQSKEKHPSTPQSFILPQAIQSPDTSASALNPLSGESRLPPQSKQKA